MGVVATMRVSGGKIVAVGAVAIVDTGRAGDMVAVGLSSDGAEDIV
jgi:hypothetical protein